MRWRARYGLILGWRVVPASKVSLRARVGLLAFAVVILGVGLAAGGGYYFAQRELHQEVDQFLERRARAVSEVVQRPADLALQRERGARPFIGRIALADFDAHVQILNPEGRPVFAISNVQLPVGAGDRRLANEGGESVRRTVHLDGRRYRMLTTALGGNGAVQVARDLGETDRALNDLLSRTIPLGVILAAAAAALAGEPGATDESSTTIDLVDLATEDRPLVFERFFRSASARAQPESGLGLAIVKQIVERHGGRVWAGTSPTGGTAVGFEIPLSEADDR